MTVHKLEERIREFINSGRRQAALLKDSAEWNKLCSSLDVIDDTQLALEAHPQLNDIKGDGASYIIVYGVLQTLLLQQDAAKHIGDALGIKVKLPKPLEDIRVIRNSAAGHPTHQKEKGLSKSSFITRMSISSSGFQLMTVYSGDKEYEFHHVSIPSLIDIQEKYITEVLNMVTTELERQEVKHRSKHKNKKLIDIFPHALSYHIGKILESTYSPDRFPLGDANLKMVFSCIEDFKHELTARDEWDVYDSINYHYELIEYPLSRLKEYFNNNDLMNEKDTYIFASFVSEQLEELKQIANELDEKYESGP